MTYEKAFNHENSINHFENSINLDNSINQSSIKLSTYLINFLTIDLHKILIVFLTFMIIVECMNNVFNFFIFILSFWLIFLKYVIFIFVDIIFHTIYQSIKEFINKEKASSYSSHVLLNVFEQDSKKNNEFVAFFHQSSLNHWIDDIEVTSHMID